jgi:molecular chaperone HscB
MKIESDIKALITKNYFEIFELLPSFNIDKAILTKLYYQKQKKYHPDNFIRLNNDNNNQSSELSTIILQLSSHINDAYYALTHDLPRAITLLKLYGVELDLAKDASLPHEFLLEQMDLYESIDDAKAAYVKSKGQQDLRINTTKEFEKILTQVQNHINNLLVQLHLAFDNKYLDQAVMFTKQLSCYLKLKSRIMDELNCH